jgi:hypothetical protein
MGGKGGIDLRENEVTADIYVGQWLNPNKEKSCIRTAIGGQRHAQRQGSATPVYH